MKRTFLLAAMIGCAINAAQPSLSRSDTIDVALFGDAPTLDPMLYTADVASTITQHIYETLYTFDSKWQVAPLLASALPTVADGGKLVTIPLRKNITFHDGRPMTADDVAASIERWARVSPRGKVAAPVIDSIVAGGDRVEMRLKSPFAPLLPLLASNNAAAAIMPKALTGSDQPVTEIVGTGPYKYVERRPGQFTRVAKYAGYSSPPGNADGYAGKREAIIDEIRFMAVTNAATRVAGLIGGQYAVAEVLPNESFQEVKAAKGVKPFLVSPSLVTFMVLNTKGGPTADPRIRLAMQAAFKPKDMLMAAFGDPSFFEVSGSVYGKGTAFYAPQETKGFNTADPKRAAEMLKQAGYDGRPLRLLASPQLDSLYKQTLVAKENLEEAGFKVEVQVMDWASVIQKRTNPNEWEGFFSYHAFTPEPSLLTFISPAYAGWWDTPEKTAALDKFNQENDPQKRVELWKAIQTLLYSQASSLVAGQFAVLQGVSDKLQGYQPSPWPALWNVKLAR